MTDEEYLALRQTPEQLIEQAEQDLLVARLSWRKTGETTGILNEADVAFSEMLIHSADIHLRLADAKMRLGQQGYRG